MPTMTQRVVMVANGTVENVFVGQLYEFAPWDAALELGIAADATGVLATVNSGADTLAEEQPVVVKTINVMPVYPDDFQFADEMMAGDRLKVKLRDTSGVIRTVMVTAKLTQLT